MIEQLLPPQARWAESFEHRGDHDLFPAELGLVERAVDQRRREFASARTCARSALAALGFPPAPILRGTRGEPLWPDGVVGSVTHCAGYCAAVVASSGPIAAIGADAEPDQPLPDGVLEVISLPDERDEVARLGATRPGVPWDRLLFSAKESTYKAWYPLTRRWLGFEEALIIIDPAARTFTSRLLVEGPLVGARPLREFRGRWLVEGGLVVTAIIVDGHARVG